MDCFAGQSVKDGQQFLASLHTSFLVAMVSLVVYHPYSIIICSLRNITSCGIERARCCLAYKLSTSIEIEVIDKELGIVSPGTDITSEVNPPQLRAVEAVTVENDIACISVMGIIVGVRGVPFEYELIVPITVYIAYAAVIRRVSIWLPVWGYRAIWPIDMNLAIYVSPWFDRLRGCLPFSTRARDNLIDAVTPAAFVSKVSHFKSGGHDLCVSDNIEHSILLVSREHAPADEISFFHSRKNNNTA